MKALDLVGKKFNRLLVLKKAFRKNQKVMWECKCDCGNITYVNTFYLTGNKVRSCGCLHKEQLIERNTTHNKRNTKLYETWKQMKERCLNKNATQYKNYGGRGISVCDEWKNDFQQFYDWAILNGYKEGLTIDRIDNNGIYCPENCRWISLKEQQRNKSSNLMIFYRGETHCLSEWCELLNLKYSTIFGRLHRNWSIERAFETPIK